MATAANAVQAAVVQGGGGEVSEEKLAFRRAMATRVEKMQFDSSLKPLASLKDKGAMQERTPNCHQQLPQQQQILFQWQQQQQPLPFYAGGAAAAAAAGETWRSRSVVANGAALNQQQKGKDGLVAAVGQQQQAGIVVDPQVVSGMIVPPTTTTTTTMTTSSAPVAPTTQPAAGLKKRIACTVLPKGMPIKPLPLHGYIDPFSQRPMTMTSSSSSTVRLHHHQHYHGVTTTSSSTTAPHEQLLQQVVHHQMQVQSFVQGNKRYKECMDYAHLGCRHFVPCNDPPDPPGAAGGGAEQQMLKRQQGVVSTVLMGRSSSSGVKASPPAAASAAGNWKEIPLARGIGVKLEPGRSFLGHFHIDPQQRSMAQVVRVGSNNSLSCCRSKVELEDEQQQQQAKQSVVVVGGGGGGGASSSAVSQVTTAAAVSCVESAESDNNGPMVENLCNASSCGGDGDGDAGVDARSDQMNNDGAGTKEEDEEEEEEEEPSPEVISAAEALDVLAHAAIRLSTSWGDDGCGELGSSRKAMFVHGDIPFVQKRVKRCARRPSRVSSQLGTAGKAAQAARPVPGPERASQRHPSRKRSVEDEFDFGPLGKKPRKNEEPASRRPAASSSKPKKKSTPKKKPATKKTKTETKTKYDEDGDGDEVVAVSSSKKSSTTPKRKKLNAVVKRSEEEARQQRQQRQQYEEEEEEEGDEEDEMEMEMEMDEHLAAAMEIQEAEEVLGALVRSKRGRNQNLPVRFQGSVMGSWKKGNRKIKPKS